MIKEISNANENVTSNGYELQKLKQALPQCFTSDGSFNMETFKAILDGNVNITNESYELKFLGKSYARLLASLDTETIIVPNEEHNGKPENVNSENVYITGDNLDALKHLLKSYEGKIKCIYIDPPYNTGSDGFVYNDKFNFTKDELVKKLSIDDEKAERILDLTRRGSASHSAWLTFMFPRLLLARDLLTKDGVIFISIDDNEQSNCKLICDDVFGENNFLTCISRATGTPTGGGFDGLVNELDYILVYARDITSTVINGLQMSEEDADIYNEVDENGNRFLSRSLRRTGGEDRCEDRPSMYYPIIAPDGGEIYPIGPTGYKSRWICGSNTAKQLEEAGLIIWKKKMLLGEMVWHPYQKYYLENRMKAPGNIWKDFICVDKGHEFLWDDIEGNKKATRDIRDLFDGEKVFETAKPIGMIEKILSIGSSENDLIVDFFGGSSTTAHAVMRLNDKHNYNKKYIIVQIQEAVKNESDARKVGYETIDQIGRERIIRAAAKIREEHPETTADLGFKHYVLQDVPEKKLTELEYFDPDSMFAEEKILEYFTKPTVLTTWLVKDGYGFNAKVEKLKLDDYTAYYCDNHLYFLDTGFDNEAMKALYEKYDAEVSFKPENVVLFGYSFTYTQTASLKDNLRKLKAVENNKNINVIVRY